ncbi:MAG: hypothetical protein RIR10_678 [Planctomycetota bacterium]
MFVHGFVVNALVRFQWLLKFVVLNPALLFHALLNPPLLNPPLLNHEFVHGVLPPKKFAKFGFQPLFQPLFQPPVGVLFWNPLPPQQSLLSKPGQLLQVFEGVGKGDQPFGIVLYM